MRTPLIAGNWKMNLTAADARRVASGVADHANTVGDVDVLICPSFTLIEPVREAIKGSPVALGAQNVYWEEKGAFTGEVSATMLRDAGCSHVIVGHSERRQYFGETDASVQRRAKAALLENLVPIVCVGETLEQREDEQTRKVIETQVAGALEGLNAEAVRRIVIAYEPVWAIGTGKTATPEQAQEVHKFIRGLISDRFGDDVARELRILYGGSMKPGNAPDLLSQADIDGGLVGGASLKAEDFNGIIDAAT